MSFFIACRISEVMILQINAAKNAVREKLAMQHHGRDSAAIARARECAQCGERLFLPEWPEYRDKLNVQHWWKCEGCGCSFETTVSFAAEVVEAA